jgi:prephenate dehydrogenase
MTEIFASRSRLNRTIFEAESVIAATRLRLLGMVPDHQREPLVEKLKQLQRETCAAAALIERAFA